MNDLRPDPETVEARAVVRWLEAAENALVSAQKVTTDRAVADGIEKARKELRAPLKRARAVLKDQALRVAAQPDLLGGVAE